MDKKSGGREKIWPKGSEHGTSEVYEGRHPPEGVWKRSELRDKRSEQECEYKRNRQEVKYTET